MSICFSWEWQEFLVWLVFSQMKMIGPSSIFKKKILFHFESSKCIYTESSLQLIFYQKTVSMYKFLKKLKHLSPHGEVSQDTVGHVSC